MTVRGLTLDLTELTLTLCNGAMSKMKKISGYERYSVSECGSVFSGTRKLKPEVVRGGYLRVKLVKDGVGKKILIHRLVAAAYVENTYNKPQVNHIDSNRQNNHYKNLEWVTNRENQLHSIQNGRKFAKGSCIGTSILDEQQVLEIKNKYKKKTYPASRLAKEYKVSETSIWNILRGVRWGHV